MMLYHFMMIVIVVLSTWFCSHDPTNLVTGAGNVILFQFGSRWYSLTTTLIASFYALSQYVFCACIKRVYQSQNATNTLSANIQSSINKPYTPCPSFINKPCCCTLLQKILFNTASGNTLITIMMFMSFMTRELGNHQCIELPHNEFTIYFVLFTVSLYLHAFSINKYILFVPDRKFWKRARNGSIFLLASNLFGLLHWFMIPPHGQISHKGIIYRVGVILGIVFPFLGINILYIFCGYYLELWCMKFLYGNMGSGRHNYNQVAQTDNDNDDDNDNANL